MKTLKIIAEKAQLTETQLSRIEDIILSHKQYAAEAVRNEIEWFCTKLGMAPYYFRATPIETIAGHIEAVKAAEIMAQVRNDKDLIIDLETEADDQAIYLVDDDHRRAMEIERRIEGRYPNYRIQSYRTSGKACGAEHLRMYLVYKPTIRMDKVDPERTALTEIACRDFLKTATKGALARYQRALNKTKEWETPLIDVSVKKSTNEHRIMIVAARDSSYRFFSNISDVLNYHNLVSNRKYIEQFSNGKTVYVVYLDKIEDEGLLQNLVSELTLVYAVPDCPLSDLFRRGKLSALETVFGVSAWSFAHQFLFAYNEEYLKIADVLKDSPELIGILRNLKTKLAKDTFTEARVWDALINNHGLLKEMFRLFDRKFNPRRQKHNIDQELASLSAEIRRRIPVEMEREILQAVLLFIRSIRRTNFYKEEKISIAFMYDPGFLNPVDYPRRPFGIFHVIGIELRGFHIRFRDIARGGIRIVRSSNYQNYINNSDFIFDENYNLAETQQRKNKDIPEGGSKGTVLLGWGYQDKMESAFKKYINGLLDLLVPDADILDYHGEEVILFLGPDEGTADLMEWASLRAKALDYPYWKSFSTGKPVSMGGIPHDLYGMTTNSVHQYVLNMLDELGWKEEEITKVMTGGPDGDLGSNEILISRDKILAIIDGSGVLYDPKGLSRKELGRLARERRPVGFFRKPYLSKDGFLVTVEQEDVFLPNGEKVVSGLEFRNTFHLNPRFKADLFVPCGGRPASININNWTRFLDEDGRPRFKIISEGANLFLTQGARLRLEEKGVVIFKDASANKGGVTSSSMEVFAGLALTDEEFDKHMCVKQQLVPAFRKRYTKEILEIIRRNATLEFQVIEREHGDTKTSRVLLSDLVSDKINAVTDAIYASDLFKDRKLFRNVVQCCCPQVLIDMVGFENVMKRVPEAYLRAVFASRMASRYVYEFGLQANEIDFHNFVKNFKG
jgi:glutamate dehydrogenase